MPTALQTCPEHAAEYVRVSTDKQRYSITNQRQTLAAYAAEHGLTITTSFSDAGKSGRRLEGRPGLQSLLALVQSGRADFTYLLVYDVSRWGRFADTDESAYYEHLCRRMGVQVIYCAEGFSSDGGPLAAILKSVKRAMAAEYSRELSQKTLSGHRRLSALGFRQGGVCGYGLRRLMIDAHGQPKAILGAGERKAVHSDRVILVRGTDEEVMLIERMFSLFVDERLSIAAISRWLDQRGYRTEYDKAWTPARVRQILGNEKYVGTLVFGRSSGQARPKTTYNPPADWVRVEGAYEPIVPLERFKQAQRRLVRNPYSDTQLLARLRRLQRRTGALSWKAIDREGPCAAIYKARFGSLGEAYRRIGYAPGARARSAERRWNSSPVGVAVALDSHEA